MKDEIVSKWELVKLSKLSSELAESELLLARLKKYQEAAVDKMDITPGMLSDLSGEIHELEESISALKAKHEKERGRLEKLIAAVPDSRVQTYLRLHYIKGMTWDEVAAITKTRSGKVVSAIVQQGLRFVKLEGQAGGSAITRKSLTDFAALSKELAKKETILDAIRHQNSDSVSADDIKELESEVESLRAARSKQLNDIERFISAVPDARVQTHMRLFYLKGLGWSEVGKVTNAVSGCAARTNVYRYLNIMRLK